VLGGYAQHDRGACGLSSGGDESVAIHRLCAALDGRCSFKPHGHLARSILIFRQRAHGQQFSGNLSAQTHCDIAVVIPSRKLSPREIRTSQRHTRPLEKDRE
jgi:hypothetical protein